jgi:hypothetical protein
MTVPATDQQQLLHDRLQVPPVKAVPCRHTRAMDQTGATNLLTACRPVSFTL